MAPISVVGDEFCEPRHVELVLKKKLRSIFSSTCFKVFDADGALKFDVDDGGGFSFHIHRNLNLASGFTLLSMRKKIMSWHSRWTAHRGDTCSEENIIFTVKASRKKFDVFLGQNKEELVPDFQVKENTYNDSDEVYRGDYLIAEINHKFTWGGFFWGKNVYNVKVHPQVDYAFIVALYVIIYEIRHPASNSSSGMDMGGGHEAGGGGGLAMGGGGD